jgi:hypothetical protein
MHSKIIEPIGKVCSSDTFMTTGCGFLLEGKVRRQEALKLLIGHAASIVGDCQLVLIQINNDAQVL